MEALKLVPYIFLTLAIAGIIAGATMITTSKFADSMDKCFNSSYVWNTTNAGGVCDGRVAAQTASVGTDNLNMTDQYYAMTQVKDGMSDVAEQFPTIGIIAVMVVIISLIAGVFVYMKFFS